METAPTTPRWRTEEYAAALQAWAEARIGPAEMTQVKLRPWSTVWRAEAASGVYWVKQNCPSQAFEGELTRLLAGLVPGRVLEPVDVRDDGAFVVPDGGPVLRELERGPADVDAWRRVVGEWATLQRDLLPHTVGIATAGVTSLPPGDLPARALERAGALHALDADDPRHLDAVGHEAIRTAQDAIAEAAAAVVELGLPMALNHNDLHDANTFVGGDGPLRFFDLADAVLAEPMSVLLVPLGQLADDPRTRAAILRAWVDVWREATDEAALWRVLPDALRLATFTRHEAWWRVMGSMTDEELVEWGRAAPYWLARMADPPPDVAVLT